MDTILDLVRTIVVVMKMTLLLPAFPTWIITFLEDLLVMKSIC